MPMKIIAVDADTDLNSERTRVQGAAVAAGHKVIPSFANLNALIAAIQAVLAANNHDCLALLEIDAHGNPVTVDHLNRPAVAAFATQLKTLNLCDEVDIYLGGCNTGVNFRGPSLAQALSAAGPTIADDNVKLTVWGSVGYLSGTHMEGNENSSERTTAHKQKFHRYPDASDGAGGPVQPGSTKASGSDCWRGFREGSPI